MIFWRFGNLNFTYYGSLWQPELEFMLRLPEYKPVPEYKLTANKCLYFGIYTLAFLLRHPTAVVAIAGV